jgi:hypothetical protein
MRIVNFITYALIFRTFRSIYCCLESKVLAQKPLARISDTGYKEAEARIADPRQRYLLLKNISIINSS